MRPDMSVTEEYKRGYADCEQRYQSIDDLRDKRIRELKMMLGTEQTMHAAWRKRAEECELKEGSAETGGEKAAPLINVHDLWGWYGMLSLLYYRADIRNWGTIGMPHKEEVLGVIAQFERACKELDKLEATFPRTTQNQTVSSGVEGAGEGTTADKSGPANCVRCAIGIQQAHEQNIPYEVSNCPDCLGTGHTGPEPIEPEKLNNAHYDAITCTNDRSVALAESSLSSPSPAKEKE